MTTSLDKLKPIFHQSTKYLASGVGVGQCTQRQNFALPNAKYTNMLVPLALGDAHFSQRYLKVAFYPTQNPNASQCNIDCVGYQRKILALAMCISLFLCQSYSRWVPFFQWNMGFRLCWLICYISTAKAKAPIRGHAQTRVLSKIPSFHICHMTSCNVLSF